MALPVHRKLYITLLVSCIAGCTWLFINDRLFKSISNDRLGGCVMKSVTHIPCPSCGTTRSVQSLLHGDITGALYWNPIGLLVLTIMVIAPCWILFDTVSRKNTLYRFYQLMEQTLKKKKFALFFALLIAGNWIWNIYKGL
jgi:hypothetical protein